VRLRSLLPLLCLALGAGVVPSGARAQPLSLEVRPADGGVEARMGPVLDARGIRNSLEAGLPVRIRVVTELWRDRFIDEQVARHEWRASVHFDPLERRYRVQVGDEPPRPAATPDDAAEILSRQLSVPLAPQREGRYYYLGRIEVETLSLSDLDELRRWLQGDLATAVEGETGVGSALGRGLQRLLIRVLGLPAERFQARSRSFDHPG
jgi:hypothetical protein